METVSKAEKEGNTGSSKNHPLQKEGKKKHQENEDEGKKKREIRKQPRE